MNTEKEIVFKQIEGRIDTMQSLAVECIEMIYNAGYNQAIEEAAKEAAKHSIGISENIRRLKK